MKTKWNILLQPFLSNFRARLLGDCRMKIKRDELSGFPYEVTKEGNFIVLRFFPKSPSAKYPNYAEFRLKLDEKERQKLIKMLS